MLSVQLRFLKLVSPDNIITIIRELYTALGQLEKAVRKRDNIIMECDDTIKSHMKEHNDLEVVYETLLLTSRHRQVTMDKTEKKFRLLKAYHNTLHESAKVHTCTDEGKVHHNVL